MTTNVVKLASSTRVIAKVGDADWESQELGSLPSEFRMLAWSGRAVRITQVTTEPVPSGTDQNVHKVLVWGVKVRCSADCKWPKIKRGELVSVAAKDLKAGDHLARHPRFGIDAVHNLPGYEGYETANLAQVKTANENIPLTAVTVQGGGVIMLSNGVFVG